MNIDIRLSVEFFDHPKTVKLKRRMGLEGVVCLQRLWIWAAQNRANGALLGLDGEAVEIAARWEGEEGALVSTLIELHFLDVADDVYVLHDWEDHQQYASKADERKDKAQRAAAARWGKAKGEPLAQDVLSESVLGECQDNAQQLPQEQISNTNKSNVLCYAHATSMPHASPSNAPVPVPVREEFKTLTSFESLSPTPAGDEPVPPPDGQDAEESTPKPNGQGVLCAHRQESAEAGAQRYAPECPLAEIVSLYHDALPEHPAVKVFSEARRRTARARWKTIGERLRGQGVEDSKPARISWLKKFFARAARSDFLTGKIHSRDKPAFIADFDFLFSPKGFTGVIEGKYDNREAA